MRRSRWWAVGVAAAFASAGCAQQALPAPEPPGSQAAPVDDWSVGLLDEDDLGDGWIERDLPDPASGVLDGLCGIPEVFEHFPPREVARFERDAVVTHAIVETDDAPGLAALLTTELELCEQEDDRVTDAGRVEIDAELPPTEAFQVRSTVESLDVDSDAVWAITTVDDHQLSVVGASVTELFEDPADPLELVTASVRDVYRPGTSGAWGG